MDNHGYIGVDLDGTLAEYYGWHADGGIGPPITAMISRVKEWHQQGKQVRIITARVYNDGSHTGRTKEISIQHQIISDWCFKHLGFVPPIQCYKDYQMIELWDDRAIQVIPNTGLRADGKE